MFIVQPLFGYLKAEHLPRATGPGKRFIRITERRYVGTEDILLGVYRFRGGT